MATKLKTNKPKLILVTNLKQLKALSANGREFFITLNNGLRSSKHIKWNAKRSIFEVENYIDSSFQRLSAKDIMDKSLTNIGKAMAKNALFKLE